MYRKAVRVKMSGYFYENGDAVEHEFYAYAVIGKESDISPVLTYKNDCMYAEEISNIEYGYVAMSKSDFRQLAKYAVSRYVGGVNESAGKSFEVTGDMFDIASKKMLKNVTVTVNETQLKLFGKITSKKEKTDGWYGMSAYDFCTLGTWCANEDECKNFRKWIFSKRL